ncbi:MAG: hypothetical protein CSB48_04675 [Proteobacteria bacterium]|nr:MAG: hypothetical protein CSB48_04675 [Pseudomonadota bacterium]
MAESQGKCARNQEKAIAGKNPGLLTPWHGGPNRAGWQEIRLWKIVSRAAPVQINRTHYNTKYYKSDD